jgi:hypothetical protein
VAPALTVVVYEALPEDTVEPLLEALYQSIVQPVAVVALNVTVPEPQRVLLLALVGAAGTAFTVIVPVAAVLTQPLALVTVTLYVEPALTVGL